MSHRTPSPSSNRHHEADTIRKTRFFHAVDTRGHKTLKEVCETEHLPERTGRYWLRQRSLIGDAAYRRTGKHRSGRSIKVSDDQLNQLLSDTNPVRDQHYDCQIKHFDMNVSSRTLRRALTSRRNARRYKKAVVRKISDKNKQLRVQYGLEHKDKSMEFWESVHWTDEAHIDPSQVSSQYILREEGTRYDPSNIEERSELKGVEFHIAASVSWHHKSPLQFYNDEHDFPEIKVLNPRKPRRRKNETDEQHHDRLLEWEASLPHDVQIKSKGNSMTQAYYVKRLLPVYLQSYNEARMMNLNPLLQEDNDNSHGTRSKDNIVQSFKAANWITTLIHPPQSPDLNPIEAVWNILKQKLRQKRWHGKHQLKQAILETWDEISMDEIRSRIAEMPDRCKMLIETGGKAIKSALW